MKLGKFLIALPLAVATIGSAAPASAQYYNGGYSDRQYDSRYDRRYDSRYNDRYNRNYDRRYDSRYDSRYDRRYNDRYYRDRCDRGTGGTVIGAIAGGLIGNEVAGRGDRTVGTIIGGAVGAIAGRAIDKSNDGCRR